MRDYYSNKHLAMFINGNYTYQNYKNKLFLNMSYYIFVL